MIHTQVSVFTEVFVHTLTGFIWLRPLLLTRGCPGADAVPVGTAPFLPGVPVRVDPDAAEAAPAQGGPPVRASAPHTWPRSPLGRGRRQPEPFLV